jgi:hypothetical protein
VTDPFEQERTAMTMTCHDDENAFFFSFRTGHIIIIMEFEIAKETYCIIRPISNFEDSCFLSMRGRLELEVEFHVQ